VRKRGPKTNGSTASNKKGPRSERLLSGNGRQPQPSLPVSNALRRTSTVIASNKNRLGMDGASCVKTHGFELVRLLNDLQWRIRFISPGKPSKQQTYDVHRRRFREDLTHERSHHLPVSSVTQSS
jgi:hypothetical protein